MKLNGVNLLSDGVFLCRNLIQSYFNGKEADFFKNGGKYSGMNGFGVEVQ